MSEALAWVMAAGCLLGLVYAAGVAVYGRHAIALYVGPICIGIGVALICAAAWVMLTRAPTLASLLAAVVALIAGNITWYLGERHWRRTKANVIPLAKALQEAAQRRQDS